MKLRKIIIGLSALGLSYSALALVGDNGQNTYGYLPSSKVPQSPIPTDTNVAYGTLSSYANVARVAQVAALPSDTTSATLRFCNYAEDSKTETIDAQSLTDTKVVLNHPVALPAGQCTIIALRGPTGSAVPIPAFKISATRDGETTPTIVEVNNIAQSIGEARITKKLLAGPYQVSGDNNKIYIVANGSTAAQEVADGTTYQNNSGSVNPDYTLCSGYAGACQDTNNMR